MLAAAALVKVSDRMRPGGTPSQQQADDAMRQHRGLARAGIGGHPGARRADRSASLGEPRSPPGWRGSRLTPPSSPSRRPATIREPARDGHRARSAWRTWRRGATGRCVRPARVLVDQPCASRARCSAASSSTSTRSSRGAIAAARGRVRRRRTASHRAAAAALRPPATSSNAPRLGHGGFQRELRAEADLHLLDAGHGAGLEVDHGEARRPGAARCGRPGRAA